MATKAKSASTGAKAKAKGTKRKTTNEKLYAVLADCDLMSKKEAMKYATSLVCDESSTNVFVVRAENLIRSKIKNTNTINVPVIEV